MHKKIVALIGNGKRHIYFAKCINDAFGLSGVVIEKKYSPSVRVSKFIKNTGFNPFHFVHKLYEKMLLKQIDARYKKAELDILWEGKKASLPQNLSRIEVNDINSNKTKNFIAELKPDLIIVSGTSLIKHGLMSIAGESKIINLHTGLSPYYRGGPCTFWCLHNEKLEYLGATIHFLTAGIDSGDIIISQRMADIAALDNEATLDAKVVMLGTSLMREAIERYLDGNLEATPQWEKGHFFAFRDRTFRKRLELERKLGSGLIPHWLSKNSSFSFSHIRTIN